MSFRLPKSIAKAIVTPGTRVALSASELLVSEFVIKAPSTNTGIMYVGAVDVASSNGYPLEAGGSVSSSQIALRNTGSIKDNITDLRDWYIDGSVAAEGVRILYIVR